MAPDAGAPSAHAASASRLSSRRTFLAVACAAAAGATTLYAGWKIYRYVSRQSALRRALDEYRRQLLVTSPQQHQQLKRELTVQLEDGLQHEVPTTGKRMLMLPTYVTQLPTGLETGDVYAIDMGGTNFRVMHVTLGQERSQLAAVESHEVAIPREVYTGTGTGLFDFLAAELKTFIDAHGGCSSMKAGGLPVVGFCFSFPMSQTALNAGVLLDWTKGFTCTGVIGEDPVRLLSEALERAGRPCRITALLNDTVGVLAAHRYLEPSTSVGVIIGTGTNACYVNRLSRLTKWPAGAALAARRASLDGGPPSLTVINIEWGAFDSPALPRCAEDWDVDAATPHAGKYLFEKLLSGMFLGEVARRVLLTLCAQHQLLGDYGQRMDAAMVMGNLAERGRFTTAHVAMIVEDDTRMLETTARVLQEVLGADRRLAPYSSRVTVRQVCALVARRSAQLVAIAVDAILTHAGWAGDAATTVAFDGGVYEKFRAYRSMVQHTLTTLRGPKEAALIQLQLSHDGSCLGAAVLAAAAAAATDVSTPVAPEDTPVPPIPAPAPTTPPAPPATGLDGPQASRKDAPAPTTPDALPSPNEVDAPVVPTSAAAHAPVPAVARSAVTSEVAAPAVPAHEPAPAARALAPSVAAQPEPALPIATPAPLPAASAAPVASKPAPASPAPAPASPPDVTTQDVAPRVAPATASPVSNGTPVSIVGSGGDEAEGADDQPVADSQAAAQGSASVDVKKKRHRKRRSAAGKQ